MALIFVVFIDPIASSFINSCNTNSKTIEFNYNDDTLMFKD